MKALSLLLFLSVFFINKSDSALTHKEYDLTKKTVVAKIKNNTIDIVVNKDAFIQAINNSMLVDINENPVNSMQVLKGTAFNDSKKEFYYMLFSSDVTNFNLVRLLHNKNGKLIMKNENSLGEEDYLSYSYFVSCEGVDSCKPTMFYEEGKLMWACGESRACLTPEEAKKNPCTKSTSIIY
ncbi:hypothetical protein GCM10007424_17350 [Flavobacterium suaedae]|uniref:Uncharacterized protein n=1 Tax=Flavobacterium suaedae TaxID=1767027 RepID=A0ABQ1JX13_9FLAO|nr:hypothetical protein [Flavobacterium suaedae]GGB77796.1 hypothetical protein GCM10007424_17350 [Flavobacterium suaedae]